MGANDHPAHVRNAGGVSPDERLIPGTGKADSQAYYAVLADRLEKLILDMQASGTASDDPLILRLADLLSETRGLLRKSKSA
jgi:hypothetical protein